MGIKKTALDNTEHELNSIKRDERPYTDLGLIVGKHSQSHPCEGGNSLSVWRDESGVIFWKRHSGKSDPSQGTIVDLFQSVYNLEAKDAIQRLKEVYGEGGAAPTRADFPKISSLKKKEDRTPEAYVGNVEPLEFYLSGKKKRSAYRGLPELAFENATIHYTSGAYDKQETIFFASCRWDYPDGKKRTLPFHKINDGEWMSGAPTSDGRRILKPLYKQLELHQASSEVEVWIVEGEKCMDALQEACNNTKRLIPESFPEVIVTTSIGGSGQVKNTYWNPAFSKNKKVRIIRDNDEPGLKYARYLASISQDGTIVHIGEGKEPGYDIFDFLEENDPHDVVRNIRNGKYDEAVGQEEVETYKLRSRAIEADKQCHGTLAEYIVENYIKVPNESISGKVVWSKSGEEIGELVDLKDLLDMDYVDLVKDGARFARYSQEEGLWVDLDYDSVLEIAKQMKKDEVIYATPTTDKDGNTDIKYSPFNANKGVIDGAIVFIRSGAKDLGDFFEDRVPAMVAENCSLVWRDEKLIKVEGFETPVGLRAKNRIPIQYKEDADYAFWEHFLKSCFLRGSRNFKTGVFTPAPDVTAGEFESAREKIRCLKQYVGALLFQANYDMQLTLFLQGPGGGGKSIFIKTVEALFGRGNVAHCSPTDLADSHKAHDLKGKLLNTVADVSKEHLLDTSLLKLALAGDEFKADEKYEKKENVVYRGGTIYSCNDLPVTKDDSEGFFRRFVHLRFPFNFTKEPGKRDKNLHRNILDRLDGVVRWAVEGFIELVENDGLLIPSEHYELEKGWKSDSNSIVAWESGRRLKGGSEAPNSQWNKKIDCYKSYCDWCSFSGLRPFAKGRFYKKLEDLGYTQASGLQKSITGKNWCFPLDIENESE